MRHLAASLIAAADFVLFQAIAVGLTIAVYFAIPLLDSSISQNSVNWNWIRIFQIISPTITVSGGAVTVLTSYFFAKRVQEAERQQQEAEQQRQEEARLRSEAEQQRQEEARLRQVAEAEVQNLKAQLERATTPRRRHRRPLRNGTLHEAQ